jgi:hypothetical protein
MTTARIGQPTLNNGVMLFARILAVLLITTSITHGRNDGPTVSPPSFIEGTEWVYVVKSQGGQAAQCEVDLILPGGNQKRLIAFAFGSKGSPVIELIDEFIVRPVRDTIGWAPGKSYNVVIIPQNKGKEGTPIDAHGEPMNDKALLIFLPKDQRYLLNEIYNSAQLFISVGGVAGKTYELPGLSKAINKLQTCPIDHIPWPAPGIN